MSCDTYESYESYSYVAICCLPVSLARSFQHAAPVLPIAAVVQRSARLDLVPLLSDSDSLGKMEDVWTSSLIILKECRKQR